MTTPHPDQTAATTETEAVRRCANCGCEYFTMLAGPRYRCVTCGTIADDSAPTPIAGRGETRDCPACDGSGRLTWEDGEEGCGNCRGTGKLAARAGSWRYCSPALLESGVNCATTTRRPHESGIGHEHFVAAATPTPETPREACAECGRLRESGVEAGAVALQHKQGHRPWYAAAPSPEGPREETVDEWLIGMPHGKPAPKDSPAAALPGAQANMPPEDSTLDDKLAFAAGALHDAVAGDETADTVAEWFNLGFMATAASIMREARSTLVALTSEVARLREWRENAERVFRVNGETITALHADLAAIQGAVSAIDPYWIAVLREVVPIIEDHDRHGDGNRDPYLVALADALDAARSLTPANPETETTA